MSWTLEPGCICAWSEHNSFACYDDMSDPCFIWAQFCCFIILAWLWFHTCTELEHNCIALMITFYICAWSEHNSFACYEDLNDACMIWAQLCCLHFLYSHEFTVFCCFLFLIGYDFLLVQNLAQLHCLDDYLNHLCMIWAQFCCFYFLYSHEFTVFYCFLSLLWPLYF